MTRKLVTVEELSKWITLELQKHEGCEDCRAGGIYLLSMPDEYGCNWNMDMVRATGVPWELLKNALSQVMTQAKRSFNITGQNDGI